MVLLCPPTRDPAGHLNCPLWSDALMLWVVMHWAVMR